MNSLIQAGSKTEQARRFWLSRPSSVLLFFSATYLVLWAGHMDSGDSSFRIAWAKSMMFHHSARIDDAGLGAAYCKYAIGHSLLAMPFLGASAAAYRYLHLRVEGPIYMLLFVVNGAVFLALVAMYLNLHFEPRQVRRTLLLLGFCTVWLPCSRMDSIEQLVLTFLFGGFLSVRLGRPIAGLLIASFAVTIRPDALIPVALLALWHIWAAWRWRVALSLAAALIPALAINAAANWVRWGTLLEAGYSGETFSQPLMVGIYGILFSAGKSVFLYSPPLLLGVFALIRGARAGQLSRDYWFFASVFLSEILFFAKWWDWSGDDCWGVRFLVPGVMLMCIPAVELLGGARFPKPAAAIALIGICVQALAVLVDPMAADYAIRHYRLTRSAVWSGGESRVDLEDVRFNPRYSPLAVNWLMLRVLLEREPAPPNNPVEIERSGTPLYLSLMASGWNPRSVECDLFWVRLLRQRRITK